MYKTGKIGNMSNEYMRVVIPPQTHRELSILAAIHGETIMAMVKRLVNEKVKSMDIGHLMTVPVVGDEVKDDS